MQLGHRIGYAGRGVIKRLLGHQPNFRLQGLVRTSVAYSDAVAGARLNLIIPAVSAAKAFGGISTAIRFFQALSPRFPRARIIVVDEDESEFEASRWSGWKRGEDSACEKTVVYLKNVDALQVESDDVYVATYWTTAEFILRVIQDAPANFGLSQRFIYLIQDFEPGFYQWSSQYLLALSTYQWPNTIAIFNTSLLRDFFDRQDIPFRHSFVFEPRLNGSLLEEKRRAGPRPKEKIILVYGRPGTPRNAFELIVEGLHLWSARYPDANSWQVLSVGQGHDHIRLAGDLLVKSCGKLSLAEYADILTRSSVGLSLMVSPHPSYPPLEMAEFGLRVVTNQFQNKNISERLRAVTSLRTTTPATICAALERSCIDHDREGPLSLAETAFLGGEVEFPFVGDLVALLSSA